MISTALIASEELDLLAEWLASEHWPFHGRSRLTQEQATKLVRDGRFIGESVQTFWIHHRNDARIGMIRLFDLLDYTPIFDLRIRSAYRGQGLGEQALQWLIRYLFTQIPDKTRLEGHTRGDNHAMQRVFVKCGFVKEAHHRRAWPSADGTVHDAVTYAILRDDWENGQTTPVPGVAGR